MRILTEVCADNLNSAITADRAGADRIELCQGLSEGGLTPSPALIRWCSSNLKLGVMVLIRPRGGDFRQALVTLRILAVALFTGAAEEATV